MGKSLGMLVVGLLHSLGLGFSKVPDHVKVLLRFP